MQSKKIKRISKREQEKINKGEPLIHPYHKKMYKVLKDIAFEYYGGYTISMPSLTLLAQMCDATNFDWFAKTLDALEKKQKIIKMWKNNELIIEIIPF